MTGEVGQRAERVALDSKRSNTPFAKCGRARRRGQGPCTQTAGWGTVHVGQGACKLHGGIKSSERDRRLKHGIYSTVNHRRVREIQEEIERMGSHIDVTQELTLARATLVDWVERHADLIDAIITWNQTRRDEERPSKVPDLSEIFPAIETISRIVYCIERGSSDKYIPRATFYRVMMAMGDAVNMRVHDENVREQIRQDWLNIAVM